tara:strand:+ start:169 stop:378 length:210 start_codon:yes stop_codon:yes gene_type:complete
MILLNEEIVLRLIPKIVQSSLITSLKKTSDSIKLGQLMMDARCIINVINDEDGREDLKYGLYVKQESKI